MTYQRKPYEKPAIIFDKALEALAADCDPDGSGTYTGDDTELFCKHCKSAGQCQVAFS